MSKARGLADLGNAYSDGALSNRNLIINGAMQVAQRGTSATGVTTTSGYYTVDRFDYYTQSSGSVGYTLSQSTDAPNGFGSSLKAECTASQTPTGNFNTYFRHKFEGQNVQSIGFGTPDAKPFTVSFWVKSSKTGPFTLSIYRYSSIRTTGLSYTVNSVNTWEYKTLTFSPDTTGAVNNDASQGFQVAWFFGSGPDLQSGTFTNGTWSSYVEDEYAVSGQTNITTIGDTFQITGVQLEVGDTATPFEHRSYSDELQSCQRYYINLDTGNYYGLLPTSGDGYRHWAQVLPVSMRASPSVTGVGGNGVISNSAGTNTTLNINSNLGNSTSSMYFTSFKLDAEL